MLIAQRPTLNEETTDDYRSRFIIEPLEPGFGYTLGNSMRRTLLSSIPGAAVTSIKIDGNAHEFSTIPGVVEDVTEIILNIKQLVLSSEEDEPVVMYLRKAGAGAVTAADIAPDGSRVALRTYTDLYEWPLEGDDVGAALAGEPVVTPLPDTRQGEGLTYAPDSASVLVSTEGEGAPVHRVPSAPLEPQAEAAPVEPVEPGAERSSPWPLVVGGGALLAVLLVVRGSVRRRRYRSR